MQAQIKFKGIFLISVLNLYNFKHFQIKWIVFWNIVNFFFLILEEEKALLRGESDNLFS